MGNESGGFTSTCDSDNRRADSRVAVGETHQ